MDDLTALRTAAQHWYDRLYDGDTHPDYDGQMEQLERALKVRLVDGGKFVEWLDGKLAIKSTNAVMKAMDVAFHSVRAHIVAEITP